ncbi:MAG: AbrB/MazE/SpoVT family DNA-binding domain-containing protein [Thaumarchaeota archaeon]|nr:AbrB/MazE/SpoVT family DNA-binding domain-containing protein [Nitrososphaerota archaeon]
MKVRVGARGTFVIPKKIRQAQSIEEGDLLEIMVEDDKLVLSKDRLWEKFRDSAKGLTKPEEVERELDEDDRLWENRLKRLS